MYQIKLFKGYNISKNEGGSHHVKALINPVFQPSVIHRVMWLTHADVSHLTCASVRKGILVTGVMIC